MILSRLRTGFTVRREIFRECRKCIIFLVIKQKAMPTENIFIDFDYTEHIYRLQKNKNLYLINSNWITMITIGQLISADCICPISTYVWKFCVWLRKFATKIIFSRWHNIIVNCLRNKNTLIGRVLNIRKWGFRDTDQRLLRGLEVQSAFRRLAESSRSTSEASVIGKQCCQIWRHKIYIYLA